MNFRCGYCGSPGPEGRCDSCGSAMNSEDYAISGAKDLILIKRWLKSRDRAWLIVDSMRSELLFRQYEDYKEGRNWKRFDGQAFDWKEI